MSSQAQSKSEKKVSEKRSSEKTGKPKSVVKSNSKRTHQKAAIKSKPRDADANKKVYKIAIRELPSNNFNEDNFKECLKTFIEGRYFLPCVQHVCLFLIAFVAYSSSDFTTEYRLFAFHGGKIEV